MGPLRREGAGIERMIEMIVYALNVMLNDRIAELEASKEDDSLHGRADG